MSTRIRFFGVLLALLSMAAFSTGSAFAQSAGCDTTGTVNGTATPTYGTVGTNIVVRATGFTVGEDVSFWFTLPSGIVAGTAQPIPNGVNADGSIGPLPFTIDQQDVNLGTGRWAVTFEGASSHHQAIIYFCVLTVAQATAVAQASPTPVPVPPTSTTAPTATTVAPAPTGTSVEATPLATAVLPTATTGVPPTSEAASPTAIAPEATATTEVLPLPTVVTPGMPTTGQENGAWLAMPVPLVLAMSLLVVGLLVRRRSGTQR